MDKRSRKQIIEIMKELRLMSNSMYKISFNPNLYDSEMIDRLIVIMNSRIKEQLNTMKGYEHEH